MLNRSTVLYEGILDDMSADDMRRDVTRELSNDVDNVLPQSDEYFTTDVYLQIDYRRFFEYPPTLIKFRDALVYQLRQFPEFTFSKVRILTRNELYHQNDQGISEFPDDPYHLYEGDYHFVFAFKYESDNPIPGFRKLIKILESAARFINNATGSHGFFSYLCPRKNNPATFHDEVKIANYELGEMYDAMMSKRKEGGTKFCHRFWLALNIMSLLVNNDKTYDRLIRVFHGYDNTMYTIKETISNQKGLSADYGSSEGQHRILKCAQLSKDVRGQYVNYQEFLDVNEWNWEITWADVDRSEEMMKGHFNSRTAKSREYKETSDMIRERFESGKLVPKVLKVYEYDNSRRFGAVMYVGHMWIKRGFEIDVTLSFYAHKDDYDLFCDNIKRIIPTVRQESLDEVSAQFSKPAGIY